MRQNRKICFLICLSLVFLLLLTSCGSISSERAAIETMRYNGLDVGFDTEGIVYESEFDAVEQDSESNEQDSESKIVWTGNISLQTMEWGSTLSDLNDLFAAHDVQILNVNESNGDYSWYSAGSHSRDGRSLYYSLRVPSSQFGDFFDAVGSVHGVVISSSKSRNDMTKTYNDNALKIQLLETEYETLNGFMEQATSVEDMLEVRDRMTDVMYELEQLNNANNMIDYDAAYSQVTLSVNEVVIYEEADADFLTRVRVAFVNSWGDFAGFLENLIIGIISVLPFLIVVAVIVCMIVRHNRKVKAKRKAEKQLDQTLEDSSDVR